MDLTNAVRLTPEQREEVLAIAARLQGQHEAEIGLEDLAEAAAQAGIEPRFVHAAAARVTERARTSESGARGRRPDWAAAGVGLAVLATIAWFLPSTFFGSVQEAFAYGAVALLLHALVGLSLGRRRLPLWAPFAMALLAATFVHWLRASQDVEGPLRLLVALGRSWSVAIAALAGTALARVPRGDRADRAEPNRA